MRMFPPGFDAVDWVAISAPSLSETERVAATSMSPPAVPLPVATPFEVRISATPPRSERSPAWIRMSPPCAVVLLVASIEL